MATVVNDDDIRIDRMELGPYGTNCYVVVCRHTNESLVVDAPGGSPDILGALGDSHPRYILLTHDHMDHTGALASLRSLLKVPLATHPDNSSRLQTPAEIFLKEGDRLPFGILTIEVMHTPGHTSGSICFKIGKFLFDGDTLFPGGPGRTNSPRDLRQLLISVTEKILSLPDDTVIYPGHGPETTVGKAKEEYTDFISRPHGEDLCGDVLWLSS